MIAIISQGHLCTHESAITLIRSLNINGKFINRRKENHSTAVYEVLHIQFTVCDVLIINDHTVVVRNKTKIKAKSLL